MGFAGDRQRVMTEKQRLALAAKVAAAERVVGKSHKWFTIDHCCHRIFGFGTLGRAEVVAASWRNENCQVEVTNRRGIIINLMTRDGVKYAFTPVNL